MFPYIVAFMLRQEVRRLEQKVLFPEKEESLASLTKSVTHGLSHLKVCPECIASDLNQYGETYWHRAHLLPGVHICARHGVALRETSIKLSEAGRELLLPQDVESRPYKSPINPEVLAFLAGHATTALSIRKNHPLDSLMRYRRAAIKAGYCRTGGEVASSMLSRDMLRFYGHRFLEETGCSPTKDLSFAWPALMVRVASSVPFSPAKHVLMATFLAFSSAASVLNYRRPGPRLPDFDRQDRLFVQALHLQLKDILTRGERITVKELMENIGAWTKFRHHRHLHPLTCQFIEEFRYSDASARQVGRRHYWRERLGLISEP